jgi:hypothetical protein
MNKRAVTISYAQSLSWTALFTAITVGASSIVELAFVDQVHGDSSSRRPERY